MVSIGLISEGFFIVYGGLSRNFAVILSESDWNQVVAPVGLFIAGGLVYILINIVFCCGVSTSKKKLKFLVCDCSNLKYTICHLFLRGLLELCVHCYYVWLKFNKFFVLTAF